jgi:hypothetical protein
MTLKPAAGWPAPMAATFQFKTCIHDGMFDFFNFFQ